MLFEFQQKEVFLRLYWDKVSMMYLAPGKSRDIRQKTLTELMVTTLLKELGLTFYGVGFKLKLYFVGLGSVIYMDGTGIKQQVIREIQDLAERHNISRVILFGSRARGDFRRTSDIDLAVEGGDFEHFSLDVNEDTSTLLEYDIVDLSRDVQQELYDSIKKEGKVIYEKV